MLRKDENEYIGEFGNEGSGGQNSCKKRVRLNYKGGYNPEENKFFLQNCGFFSDSTPFGEKFNLKPSNKEPEIDFELLSSL